MKLNEIESLSIVDLQSDERQILKEYLLKSKSSAGEGIMGSHLHSFIFASFNWLERAVRY